MTELVDQMTGTGYYDIYTDTCEKLQFKIKTVGGAAFVNIINRFFRAFLSMKRFRETRTAFLYKIIILVLVEC